jgi:hypothetical protein
MKVYSTYKSKRGIIPALTRSISISERFFYWRFVALKGRPANKANPFGLVELGQPGRPFWFAHKWLKEPLPVLLFNNLIL